MARINENLVRALVCDVGETDAVTKNIISYIGEVKTYSWRYPNLRGDTIEPMTLMKKFSGSLEDHYLFLMELLIDRLNFFFHALLQFLESFPFSTVADTQSKYVSLPSFMSISALIRSTWERVKTVYGGCMDKMEDSIYHHISSMHETSSHHSSVRNKVFEKGSQTILASLTQCENCHLSMNIVKEIINCIEKLFEAIAQANENEENQPITEAVVSRVKNEFGPEIWEVTQWKVMTKIAEAVVMDTHELENQLTCCFSEKCQLSKELKIGKKEVCNLNDERRKLLKDLITFKNTNSDLMESNVKLKKMLSNKENEVKSLSALLDESKTSNENLKKDSDDIEEKLMKVQSELMTVREDLAMKSDEACIYKKKYMKESRIRKRAQGETNVARRAVEQLEEQLVSARRNADTMTSDMEGERVQFLFQLQELQEKLEQAKGEKEMLSIEVIQLRDEKSSFTNEMQKLKSKLEEMKEEGMLMAKYPDLCQRMDLELVGIPEVDMENQVKSNNIRIKFLLDENAALEKTIKKLKAKRKETAV